MRRLISHLAKGLGQRLALELEAARRHRDPERGDRLTAHIAHGQCQAAEVRSELLAVERDSTRTDLGKLRAKLALRHDRGKREGPQPVSDVALQAALVEQRQRDLAERQRVRVLADARAQARDERHALPAAGERDHNLPGVRGGEVDALARPGEELVENAAEASRKVPPPRGPARSRPPRS